MQEIKPLRERQICELLTACLEFWIIMFVEELEERLSFRSVEVAEHKNIFTVFNEQSEWNDMGAKCAYLRVKMGWTLPTATLHYRYPVGHAPAQI